MIKDFIDYCCFFFLFSLFRTLLHSGADNDEDDNNDDNDYEDTDFRDSSLWLPLHPGLPFYVHQDSGLSTDVVPTSTPLPHGHGNMVGYDILF